MERTLEPELMDGDDEAAAYDAMDHSVPNRAFVERLLSLGARGRMLDIGTGPAHIPIMLLEAMRDEGSRVVALDASRAMLELARRNVARAQLAGRVELTLGNATELRFPDGCFDAVFSNTILHHIADPRPFLAEALRVLAPGGVLLIRDLFRPSAPERADELVALHAKGATEKQRALLRASLCAALTPDELRRIVAELGVSDVEVVIDSDRHMSLQRGRERERPRLTLAHPGPRDARAEEPREPPEPPRRPSLGSFSRPPHFLRRTGAAAREAQRLERLLSRVERAIDLGTGLKEAKRLLAELPKGPYLDPAFHVRVGDAFFDLGKLSDAELHYRAALLRDPEGADTLHRLGMVYGETGREREMVAAWLQTRRLDARSPRAPWAITEDAMAEIAEETLARLPEELSSRLGNLPVMIADLPSEALIEDGVDPRVLGLITGVPLSEQGTMRDATPVLDCVLLYQRNIERFSSSFEELRLEIGKTVVHEVLHYFGLDEEELERLGLG